MRISWVRDPLLIYHGLVIIGYVGLEIKRMSLGLAFSLPWSGLRKTMLLFLLIVCMQFLIIGTTVTVCVSVGMHIMGR